MCGSILDETNLLGTTGNVKLHCDCVSNQRMRNESNSDRKEEIGEQT